MQINYYINHYKFTQFLALLNPFCDNDYMELRSENY